MVALSLPARSPLSRRTYVARDRARVMRSNDPTTQSAAMRSTWR